MMGGKMIKNGVGLNGLPLDELRRNRLCQEKTDLLPALRARVPNLRVISPYGGTRLW
ncbi:hypothetical protein MetMK1DRAFT_00015360 [Metallosphaera yellowstonensis MK1]|uniref:Uncharacterized protein n=1 Tax=Metallosphaera yellowstonensis MK1 TaxID=671065 RepID=H2C4L4_9CREN|nr:hypothetical protein MetMK1DRAFT_00015360 [Metallosphaera yellowstonensis MK1]